jgi:uncharacterized membrane protein YgcG
MSVRSPLGRVYVATATLAVFFLLWAVVAAHPWAPTPPVDPRLAALTAREQTVTLEVAHARAAVARKWSAYDTNLKRRRKAIARANAAQQKAVARARAIALTRRRVVYGTSGGSGSSGRRSYGGSRGGGGGGSSSGGGGSAPPIVSVGSGAPVSSSGTS